jgi:hypothetical protein
VRPWVREVFNRSAVSAGVRLENSSAIDCFKVRICYKS